MASMRDSQYHGGLITKSAPVHISGIDQELNMLHDIRY